MPYLILLLLLVSAPAWGKDPMSANSCSEIPQQLEDLVAVILVADARSSSGTSPAVDSCRAERIPEVAKRILADCTAGKKTYDRLVGDAYRWRAQQCMPAR